MATVTARAVVDEKSARWFRHIEERHLAASQLPTTIVDQKGTLTKPPTW